VIPGAIERSPEALREVTRQVRLELQQWIGRELLADEVVVGPEERHGGQELQGRAPARHPRPKLPGDGRPYAPIPAVLADVQRLAAVVLADRHGEVGDQVERKPRLVAQGVDQGLLRRWPEEIDVELEGRVAEPAGHLTYALAGRSGPGRDPPHRQDDRGHGRAVVQGECACVARQGQCPVEG
jgi:hypothetical protein